MTYPKSNYRQITWAEFVTAVNAEIEKAGLTAETALVGHLNVDMPSANEGFKELNIVVTVGTVHVSD